MGPKTRHAEAGASSPGRSRSCQDTRADAALAPLPEPPTPVSRGPAVLYVDDEPQSIKYFSRAFGAELRVLTAGSTAEADRVLAQEAGGDSGGIGVLVTDQRMPVETGIGLLVRVKERYPTVIRVLTTAYGELDDALAAVNRGEIHRYILKPWDMGTLRSELHACLRLHQERRLEQDLLRARRHAMVALASYMAHELATPLASIATAAEGLVRYLPALMEGYRHPELAHQPAAIPTNLLSVLEKAPSVIQESVNRSRMLVRLLLMNAGPGGAESEPLERLSVAQLVADALGSYPFTGDQRDQLRVEGHDFSVSGPPTLLIHVLHNLVKNALDGIHAAGRGSLRLGFIPGRDWNRLTVTDTGAGIEPASLPHIFDEFFSLKGPGRGTGMGLPFCRRVMNNLGGEIACRSVLGEYTQLELRFPPLAVESDSDHLTPEDMP